MTAITTERGIEVDRLYRAGPSPELIDVPELNFLMIDGHGDPNVSPRFQEAIQALYGVSYALKFALKRSGGPDYKVPPLEGLWWMGGMAGLDMDDKAAWEWTAMIKQPFEVTAEMVEAWAADVAGKKSLPTARELRLQRWAEGLSAQVLHIGPYAAEPPTIRCLLAFIEERGYAPRGKHHEIYLGDPRRATPERLKTIIRQPVERR